MEFYGSQSEIIDEATLKKQTINYIDLNFSELKKTIELLIAKKPHENDYWFQHKHPEEYEKENYEVSSELFRTSWKECWDGLREEYPITEPGKEVYTLPRASKKVRDIINNVIEYGSKNGVQILVEVDHFGDKQLGFCPEIGYEQWPFSIFVLHAILKVLEKKLNKEICYTYPRGFDDGGTGHHVWASDHGPISTKIRVFFKDYSDPKVIYDMILEELKNLNLEAFNKNVQVNEPEYGKARPRAKKKIKEMPLEEKVKLAQSALSDILEYLNPDVLAFMKKKNLIEEFKQEYIDTYTKRTFSSISFRGSIMIGDADGERDDDYTITFDEWDYLKEWWDEYVKVYPVEKFKDDNIYLVGYEEAGMGAWSIEGIDQIFESKEVRAFSFDNGWSSVQVSINADMNAKFENEYEGIKDEPDNNFDGLFDKLLCYATYWKETGKMLQLPECF